MPFTCATDDAVHHPIEVSQLADARTDAEAARALLDMAEIAFAANDREVEAWGAEVCARMQERPMSLYCRACGHAITDHQAEACACCVTKNLSDFGYWRCPECHHARDFDQHAPWTDRERISVDDDALCEDCDYAGPMPFFANPAQVTEGGGR
jgi:hypothetical protein